MFLCVVGLTAQVATGADARANPIRKVVSLMQTMQKEVEETGEKEKELFDKFMCYCQGGDADLKQNIVKASGEIEALNSRIPAETAEKTQMAAELKQHGQDKAGAQKDLSEAQAMRNKENAEHKALAADLKTNMNGVSRAIPALEKGMGGAAFMQMPGADVLANLLDTFSFADASDRRNLLAFVQQGGDYAPASGQIVGILKGMKDTMESQLKEAVNDESGSQSAFDELKASKESEVQIATQSISAKTKRSGDLAVSISQAKDSLEDTEEELADTERLAEQLSTQCATKEQEWAERQKVRAAEVLAISEAIGILNDDDALDTFKKAIPSSDLVQVSRVSLLQRTQHRASAVVRARALLAHIAASSASQPVMLMLFTVNSKLKLIQGAGAGGNFDEVVVMIDDMVKLLEKNQADDNSQRDYCKEEFHTSAGEERDTARALEKVKNMIEERNDLVAQLVEDIKALEEGIKSLDKSVALATEQRKEEHAESVQTATLNQAALGLVEKAKNRLNKFYSPSEYKAPPTTTESPSPYGFVQLSSKVHVHRASAARQAPEEFGSYEKGRQSGGVIMMMEQIAKDIELDMQEGAHDEQEAQKQYTELMNDSSTSRAQDVKSITQKEASKAQLQIKLEQNWERRRSTEEQLALTQKYIRDLHSKCDFLMKNFDERKQARAQESNSLKQAKATLSGAAA